MGLVNTKFLWEWLDALTNKARAWRLKRADRGSFIKQKMGFQTKQASLSDPIVEISWQYP